MVHCTRGANKLYHRLPHTAYINEVQVESSNTDEESNNTNESSAHDFEINSMIINDWLSVR